MRRILFYYTHRETLGHTTRVINIIKSIIRKYGKKVEIFVLNGGIPQKYLEKPADVKWFDIPFPYYGKWTFSQYMDKRFIMIEQYKIKVRREYVFNKANKIQPDIFITEFFPFGRKTSQEELIKTLEFLKRKGSKIFASIGYPYIVPANINTIIDTEIFYDTYFIHVPEDTETKYFIKNIKDEKLSKIYKGLLNKINSKIIYTGYIIPPHFLKEEINNGKKETISKKGKLILVSRGGGVAYSKIILFAILASKYFEMNYKFLILAGPATPELQMKLFQKAAKRAGENKIILKQYEPNFFENLLNCDLSISMAGYNTSVQLLLLNKKSIVVPFEPYIENYEYCSEQRNRAEFLRDCIYSKVIKYNELGDKVLYENILEKLNEPWSVSSIKKEWFCGSDVIADSIAHN